MGRHEFGRKAKSVAGEDLKMRNIAQPFRLTAAFGFLVMAFVEHAIYKDPTGTLFGFIGAIMLACTSIILTRMDEFARTIQ